MEIQILENEIIRLVPMAEDDFERLYKVASDPEIWDQHPDKFRYKREVFRKFFQGAIESERAFLIIDVATDQVIGGTRYYDYKPVEKSIAIGYTFFGRSFWGGPHNRATKDLMLDYAFQYLDKVLFHVAAENHRSQKAVLKLGASRIGVLNIEIAGDDTSHCEFVVEKSFWISKK